MANSYSAPSFNVDTSTNLAGLEAIKGGAIASTDNIYIYNGATVTCEKSFSVLKIVLGQTSGGAAGAGGRYGLVVFSAGITCTFTGAGGNGNSGVVANPTSADTSSKNCEVIANGTQESPVTFTNSLGAQNTNYRWTFWLIYGSTTMTWPVFRYYFQYIFYSLPYSSSLTTKPMVVTDASVGPIGITGVFVYTGASGVSVSTSFDLRRWTIDCSAACGITIFAFAAQNMGYTTGFYVDMSGFRLINYNAQLFRPFEGAVSSGLNAGSFRLGNANIRPTTIVPTSIVAGDTTFGKTLSLTIGNVASYADADFFEVATEAGTMIARFSKARYVAQGNIGYTTPVLTNGIAYRVKVRASSDNNTFSEWSELSNQATPSAPAGGSRARMAIPLGVKRGFK
jgi:hypothetical protein